MNRARLVFTLTALIPTILMTVLGIIFLAIGGSKSMAVVGGILVLSFCAVALAGYIIGTIFVKRGASLAAVQNEFLALVSHELRTPLTSIRMFIDTLREERVQDAAEKQRCLTVINQELKRLDGLVGRLIELSKIEHRHAVFDRRFVSVADIVADALASFEAIKVGGHVDLNVKLEPDLVVYGDRAALAQAVGNLLGNAWKYTRKRPDARIEFGRIEAEDMDTYFVRDNGAGFDMAYVSKLFGAFQRLHGAYDFEGHGIGLATVRRIIQRHNGRIWGESINFQGATFYFALGEGKLDPVDRIGIRVDQCVLNF